MAFAASQNENLIRQREEAISNRSSQEFPGSQRIADLYTWLRKNFDADNFYAWLNNESRIDLAALLRQLIQCGLGDDDRVWKIDTENNAFILTVPEVLITASNGFNQDTRADWETVLQTLPSRHAAIRTANGDGEQPRTSILRVVDVPDSLPESGQKFQTFLHDSRDANSQSEKEIAAVELWREAEIDRLAEAQVNAVRAAAIPASEATAPGPAKPPAARKPGRPAKIAPPAKTAPPKATKVREANEAPVKIAPPKAADALGENATSPEDTGNDTFEDDSV